MTIKIPFYVFLSSKTKTIVIPDLSSEHGETITKLFLVIYKLSEKNFAFFFAPRRLGGNSFFSRKAAKRQRKIRKLCQLSYLGTVCIRIRQTSNILRRKRR